MKCCRIDKNLSWKNLKYYICAKQKKKKKKSHDKSKNKLSFCNTFFWYVEYKTVAIQYIISEITFSKL